MRKIGLLSIAALILISSFGTALGQQSSDQKRTELIPRALLFGDPERASPRISPDGTKLAYLAEHNGALNIFVRTLGKQDDRAITSSKRRIAGLFFWQLDNEHILYLQDQAGDENAHLFQTSIATGQTRDLTPFVNARAHQILISPDHPKELLVGLNLRDRRLYDLYRVDLTSGAVTLDTQNPGDVRSWVTDENFRVRAATAATADGSTLVRVRDSVTAPWREIYRSGPQETFGGVLTFTTDQKGLLVISSVGANAARLIEVDLEGKLRSVIGEDPRSDIGTLMINPLNGEVEAVAFFRARLEWQLRNKQLQADFDKLNAQCGSGDLQVVSRDFKDRNWIVSCARADAPECYYLYDRGTQQASLLFTTRPQLERYRLAPMQPIAFTARDGMQIHGYLTLPVERPARNLPLVLLVHGGPWSRDYWGYNGRVQWLANRGYAVLQINFRGSTGYGKDYLNAGDREWGGKMITDLVDGKRWAVEQGYADARRVAIFGGSYGGYATLSALAFQPDEFACGVDLVGPSNLITMVKHMAGSPLWPAMKGIFDKRVGSMEKDEEFLKAQSPLFKADQIKAPLLIAQGANDARAKQSESDQIVAALRAHGKTVDYLLFPDEGHGFAREENRRKFHAAAEQFLARHLGGQFQAIEPVEDWQQVKK